MKKFTFALSALYTALCCAGLPQAVADSEGILMQIPHKSAKKTRIELPCFGVATFKKPGSKPLELLIPLFIVDPEGIRHFIEDPEKWCRTTGAEAAYEAISSQAAEIMMDNMENIEVTCPEQCSPVVPFPTLPIFSKYARCPKKEKGRECCYFEAPGLRYQCPKENGQKTTPPGLPGSVSSGWQIGSTGPTGPSGQTQPSRMTVPIVE